MPKQKKKIGWWRMVAKWVFAPLMATGKEAVKEAIPDEHKPLEDLAVLSIEIAQDMIEIHTDLDKDNKKQVSQWWKDHNSEIITTSLSVIMYAGQLAMDKINNGDQLTAEEQKHARLYKVLKGL